MATLNYQTGLPTEWTPTVQQGYDASLRGEELDQNPYGSDDSRHESWEAGWMTQAASLEA